MEVDERIGRLEVYNELLKNSYMTADALSQKLNKNIDKIEMYISDLRYMFKDNEVDRYVCASPQGYYLSSDTAFPDFEVQNNKSNKAVKKNKHNKHSKNNNNHNESFKHGSKVLTLDLKKKFDDQDKLLKINIVDEKDDTAFSLTIGWANDTYNIIK